MDVICVVNVVTGELHCTEFYVKFKSTLIDEGTAAILGINSDGLYQQSNNVFNEDDGSEKIVKSSSKDANIPPPEPDWVDVLCNKHKCEGVIAYIGKGKLLHFYDPVTMKYSVTPSNAMMLSFNLEFGKNHVVCWHRSTGIAKEFNIWKYRADEKLVIMDIDGTITKSDITGYIQTVYMGLYSHVHEGVVTFLNVLRDSYQYNIIYLSSRPMIHRKETKQLLENIKDEYGLSMPDGPLFTNKERILFALYREITKNTVEFKSQVLFDIAVVFKTAGCRGICPYVLGVGNKENDAVAYNSVGVPSECILVIDPNSQIFVWKYSQHIKKASNSGYVTNATVIKDSQVRFRDSSNEIETLDGDLNSSSPDPLEGINDSYFVKFNTYKDENLLRYITRVSADQRSSI